MNYTIAEAIRKLSKHSKADDYSTLCELIRKGTIQTCFDVYGVAIAVVKRCNRLIDNKEVVGIRFFEEHERLTLSPHTCYRDAISDLILEKIKFHETPLVIDASSNKFDYVLLKGASLNNIDLLKTFPLDKWHIFIGNPLDHFDNTYVGRPPVIRDLKHFNIYPSFITTKLSLLIEKSSLDQHLNISNSEIHSSQTVSDSYIEAKKYVAHLSDLCWEADIYKILTRTWIAEEIREKLKGHKYEEELPEKDESLAKDWITHPKPQYSSNPGRRSKLEKESAKALLKQILELNE